MNCPYCSKEMQAGYLHNGNQPNQWIPEGKKPSVKAFSVADGSIELKNKFSLFKTGGYNAIAYYCNKCHIVLAPTEQ